MALKDKLLQSINRDDLQALIDAEVPEGRDLEYKQELPGNSDGNKKEYLSDVSSFANAGGGILLYGVEEQDGIAVGLPGIPTNEIDAAILRLESMAQDGIDERIPGLRVTAIQVSDTHSVVAMKIPRSWVGPHMVMYRGSSRFFSRNSRGKYPMDIRELQRVFGEARTVREDLQSFRVDRVSAVISGKTPVPLYDGPKLILHVAPLNALKIGPQIDIAEIDPHEVRLRAPRSDVYHNIKYNFDGLAASPPADDNGITPAYAQLFRNGIIEGVSSTMIYEEEGQLNLWSMRVEPVVIETVERYVTVARALGLEPPYAIMLTLTGVEGYRVIPETRNRSWNNFRHPIDRDVLFIPEVVVESGDFDAAATLRPVFDILWQSAGWQQSMNYTEDGTHRPTAES